MLLTLVATIALATEPRMLTPEQQREDFDELWSAMDRMHPSLHLYTSPEAFADIRSEVRARLDEPRTPGAFWAVLMESVTPIGCGHTPVFPPDDALRSVIFDGRVFPLDLVVNGGELHVDPRTHEEGGRIVSVQGVEADEVLRRLRGFTNADGLSTAGPDHELDGMAPYYLPFAFGEPPTYEVVVERAAEPAALTLHASGPFDVAEGSDPGPRFDDERYEALAVDPASGARARPSRRNLRGRVLLLTFDGFRAGQIRRHAIKPLLRGRRAGVQGVVVDLRRNGGGSPWPAFALFGHLISEDEPVYDQKLYRWPHRAEWLAGRADNGRYARLTAPEHTATLDIEEGLLDTGYGKDGTLRAKKRTYEGPVVVLTSGHTFSTGADLAALVKRNGRGTIVGEPTGGSATVQTSGNLEVWLLAHSRIRVVIPLNRSRLVDPAGGLAGSVGVAPDHPVQPTLDDLRRGADPALERALELASLPER